MKEVLARLNSTDKPNDFSNFDDNNVFDKYISGLFYFIY